jgi:uncharacterized protein
MRFEWDENKNNINRIKHGIAFEIAMLVFDDPFHITDQARWGGNEERWLTIGSVEGIITVTVIHTNRGQPPDDGIRIISARRASRRERTFYEQAIGERA